MARIRAHSGKSHARSRASIQPVDAAAEATITDSEKAVIPLRGHKQAEAVGGGWGSGDFDGYGAEFREVSGVGRVCDVGWSFAIAGSVADSVDGLDEGVLWEDAIECVGSAN